MRAMTNTVRLLICSVRRKTCTENLNSRKSHRIKIDNLQCKQCEFHHSHRGQLLLHFLEKLELEKPVSLCDGQKHSRSCKTLSNQAQK